MHSPRVVVWASSRPCPMLEWGHVEVTNQYITLYHENVPRVFLRTTLETSATRRVLVVSGVVQERHTDRANALPCSTGQRAARIPPDLGSTGGYYHRIMYWGAIEP